MTQIETILPAHLPPRSARAIQICWTSQMHQRGEAGRRTFILSLHLQSLDQAMVEAWIEHNGSRRCVMERQPLRVDACIEDRMLHVDVMGHNGDGRIAAVSVLTDDDEHNSSMRPLYAHTSLLQQAGFNAGSYDAPRLAR